MAKRKEKSRERNYGPHLLLDCYEADPAKLADLGLIFEFLDQLPKLIKMQKIGPPQMCQFKDSKIAGVTGIVMIVTSHISIHTYSRRGYFFMDVFSCKPFDRRTVEAHVRKTFGVRRMRSRMVQRGREIQTGTKMSSKRGGNHAGHGC